MPFPFPRFKFLINEFQVVINVTAHKKDKQLATKLFETLNLRSLELSNRVVVAPMTQFSARDGVAGDWHLMHLGQYAVSGASMILTESTYVAASARNATSCLSLYSDEQESAINRIAEFFDINGDGNIDLIDVILLINMIIEDNYNYLFDINSDESIDALDVLLLLNIILMN